MNITIEKNIPMPERGLGVAATLKAMSVGDSVVLPKSKIASWRTTANRNGYNIAIRSISDYDCRIWRVS